METKPLGEFNIYINDGNYGGIYPEKELFLKEGIPLISSSDFSGRTFNYEGIKFISEELHFGTLTKGHLKINDVIVVVRGSVGKVGFFKDEIGECNLNPQLAFIRTDPKELNPLYLYYLLSSKKYSELLKRFATGSVQPQLPINRLKLIPIVYPDISTQQKIAAILSALDAKIELNQRINAELESMAKTLYDYWFVQFAPHKSAGGKMVWNEELKREIPLGWDSVMIGEILEKEPKTKKILNSDILPSGKIPVIDQSADFIAGFTDDEDGVIKVIEPRIVFGDHTRILKLINFDFARGADGTQVLLSNTNRLPQHLLYHTLLKIDLSNYGYARHFKFLKETRIILPDETVSRNFENIAKSYYNTIKHNVFENQVLIDLRDWLLPMLMNGQVTVG